MIGLKCESSGICLFRVVIIEGEIVELTIFYPHIEEAWNNLKMRPVEDWVNESLTELNISEWGEWLNIDSEKNWQVVGEVEIIGETDYFGEYSEDIVFYNIKIEKIENNENLLL